MTIDEAVELLRPAYATAPDGRRNETLIIFGVRHADELNAFRVADLQEIGL